MPNAAPQSYVYDWRGLMARRTTTATTPVVPNQYEYDLSGQLVEEQANGVAQVDYIWAAGRPVATWTPATASLTYIVTDRLNQPRLALKPSGTNKPGTVTWTNAASPFGVQSVAGGIAQDLRLPGQVADPNGGWYHNGQRDYLPGIGRYLESDPIGLAGGTNTYGYARQNPFKWTDPSGLDPYGRYVGSIAGQWIGGLGGGLGGEAADPFGGGIPGEVWGQRTGGWIGGNVGDWAGDWLSQIGSSSVFNKSSESKPKDCPLGTRPIDKMGYTKDQVHGIKDSVDAGPRDWTGISPSGDVITSDQNGNTINNGPVEVHLP